MSSIQPQKQQPQPWPAPLSSLHWRRYGASLLPLALAGLLPPWALLVLCLLLGLGVYSPRWAQARLAGLLVVGALLTVSMLLGWQDSESFFTFFSGLALTYLKVMAGLVLLHLALLYLQDGQRLGLLFILLAGLLAPQPGLLLALLAGATLRPDRDDVMGQHPPTPQEQLQGQRGWGVTLLVGALLVGLAAGLPRHYSVSPAGRVAAQAAPLNHPLPNDNVPTATLIRPHVAPGAWSPLPPPSASGPGLAPLPLPLLTNTLLLALLALGWQLLHAVPAARQRQKPEPIDLLLPLGLLLNMLVLDILGLARGTGDSVVATGTAQQVNIKLLDLTVGRHHFTLPAQVVNGAAWLLWLLTLAALALTIWRSRRKAAAPVLAAPEPRAATVPTESQAAASNRVRLAYAQAEQALAQAGYPRQVAETPGQYAARIQQLFSALGEPFGLLTALYQPVRYGKAATDPESAEEAAQAVTRLAAELPAAAPTKETP